VTPAAVAAIRPAALRSNLQVVRRSAPGCPVLAVIKTNAYGHGLVPVARILSEAGVEALAVARLEEARQLREAGIAGRLVVLGGFASAEEARLAGELALDVVIHDLSQVVHLEARTGSLPLRCWLKIDTGMGRLGFPPPMAPDVVHRLQRSGHADGLVLMSHLACADDLKDPATPEQIAAFNALLGNWPGDISLANSAAILQWPQTVKSGHGLRYSGRNWVRPGLMLFGASPLAGHSARDLGLCPAMSFESRLLAIKAVKAGQRAGYGGHWSATRDSVLGVVAAGYADGYPWQAPAGTPVRVHGKRAPVVGRISMDMITVDLTEVPEATVGDRVILWGDDPTVDEVAAAARTIPWTLLTGINRRVAVRLEPELTAGVSAAGEEASASVS
jgi:alanine racemase